MLSHDITINVDGPRRTGTTVLTGVILAALRRCGYHVEVLPVGFPAAQAEAEKVRVSEAGALLDRPHLSQPKAKVRLRLHCR